ncbi:alkylation response protein AidB-like acyl-CoA dehydrogenase [Actinoplanes lutulentus]|uniref:Alkylation response protein AidB-like acyl-CoA dehydrogenase n=1 Tax=Actinoplanes lutulentus TaxID=1287878 RepID=A0A327ZBQ2_9ACTN|nr:acyl-CoA dehydrogenase family protein [Actinoplanes lutulentus]MBB2947818.1 alkylation response protein AidB-like acyl-CoA dehydrogenase [Actinoplanes lutulentus]RAK29868.1 alkylation response protein AidB-like acyl-CoA dehydrogenase [Actinoplanes lutulentus]
MDFDDTPDEAAWRTEVRSFLDHNQDRLSVRTNDRARQALLYDAGFVGVTWPIEAGGRGGTPMQQAIVDQEMSRLGLPGLINLIGIGMCGPTVILHGSDDQKQRYLQRLLRADDLWCQLFSEPSAGSDLAALRTRAVRENGAWRITGQKVWTTLAHLADYGILLARTDPDVPKHRGLTMFVVDMKAPGVTVRPLRQMNGDAHFNEVFFDDVVIPDAERLGEPGDGWTVALTTLMNERLSLGGGGTTIGPKPETVARHLAGHIGALPADRQALARQELGRGYVAALGARYTGYRQLSKLSRGEFPGPEASAGKLSGTRSARDLTDLAVRVLGGDARVAVSRDGTGTWQTMQAVMPGMAIAGGSDQVLRNIIGERVLGLPAEPRADKGVPR